MSEQMLVKKPRLTFRSRKGRPADAFPPTPFNALVREACEVTRRVESMKSLDSCRLTAKALLKDCIALAESTPERIKELHRLVDHGTGFEDCQRSVRRATTFLEGRKWSQAPRDPRSLNWLFTEASRHELAVKNFSQTELFCVAIERAAEFLPEIFGTVTSSAKYAEEFATLQKRQNELMAQIAKGYTAEDLQISELDRSGRGTVSFKLTSTDVLLVPESSAAERLVACLLGRGW